MSKKDAEAALTFLLAPSAPRGGIAYEGRYIVYYHEQRMSYGGGEFLSLHNGIANLVYPGGPVMTAMATMIEVLSERGIPYVTLPRAVRAQRGIEPIEVLHSSASLGRRGVPATLFTAWRKGGARRRRALMLSGPDKNERRNNYYCCELPPSCLGKVTNIVQAYEALKPEAVRQAEALKRKVRRQGDIFAIPMPSLDVSNFQTSRYILGTNHVGQEVCVGEDGMTYARGRLSHQPQGRAADHAAIILGDKWHLMLRNTVPLGKDEPPPSHPPPEPRIATAEFTGHGYILTVRNATGSVVYTYNISNNTASY